MQWVISRKIPNVCRDFDRVNETFIDSKEYKTGIVFTGEQLKQVAWAAPLFTDAIPLFRWSGMSGKVLTRDAVSVVDFIPVPAPDGWSAAGFAVVAVRAGDGALASLFTVPLGIVVSDTGWQSPTRRPKGALFHFDNGTEATVGFLIDDLAFWRRLGRAMLSVGGLGSAFLIDMLDPGFSMGVKSIRALKDDDGIELGFLGGGDTTNIIIKFTIPQIPGLVFVFKFYPRIAFNTARYLNDMLASAKFHQFARLVASCDYQPDAIQRFFNESMIGTSLEPIKQVCASMNIPVNRFFPFIHLIQFIPGQGDGGMPFWNSAVGELKNSVNPPGADVAEIAAKLGRTIAGFHQALKGKAGSLASATARHPPGPAGKLKGQLEKTQLYLSAYREPLSSDLHALVSSILQRLDYERFAEIDATNDPGYLTMERQYIHQDLHMGQLMYIDALKEFYILDLEGDPQLPWNERLECSPIERDIASLVRSLSYIKIAALRDHVERELSGVKDNIPQFDEIYPLLFLNLSGQVDRLYSRLSMSLAEAIRNIVTRLNGWERNVQRIILDAYNTERPVSLKALEFFKLQRILNEIAYEIKFRPKKVFIPCAGLLEMIDA